MLKSLSLLYLFLETSLNIEQHVKVHLMTNIKKLRLHTYNYIFPTMSVLILIQADLNMGRYGC
mgnify:CR=1 FL=1